MSNSVNDLRNRAKLARQEAEKFQVEASRLEGLADDVEKTLNSPMSATAIVTKGAKTPTASAGTGRRGRPPGSTNKPKDATENKVVDPNAPRRGRPPGSTNKPKDATAPAVDGAVADKRKPLHAFIMEVLKQHPEGAELKTIVKGVGDLGYQSQGNLSSNISTTLSNMTKKEKSVDHNRGTHLYKLLKVA